MSKYIVYCLDISSHNLEIISIEEDEREAKNIQNSHSFTLLCDLNKNQSLYKLEVKLNIIQIIEVNININSGWISNKITENKTPIYEVGIISYSKKEKFSLNSQDIQELYIPGNVGNKNSSESKESIPIPKPPPQIFKDIKEIKEGKDIKQCKEIKDIKREKPDQNKNNVKQGLGLSSVLTELKNRHKKMNLD